MERLMRRKLNRVAELDLARENEFTARYRDLAYIVLEIPKESFGFPEWNPGKGYVQSHNCCFVKADGSQMTFMVGPLYSIGNQCPDYDDEDSLVVYTKSLPMPLDEDGQYAFHQAFDKPRRIITDHGYDEVISWKDHPWRLMQDANDFWWTLEHGFEPMTSLGTKLGDWDYTSIEANMLLPKEGTYGVVIPWGFWEYQNQDYAYVEIATKILRKWGGRFRIVPGRERLFISNLLEWRF